MWSHEKCRRRKRVRVVSADVESTRVEGIQVLRGSEQSGLPPRWGHVHQVTPGLGTEPLLYPIGFVSAKLFLENRCPTQQLTEQLSKKPAGLAGGKVSPFPQRSQIRNKARNQKYWRICFMSPVLWIPGPRGRLGPAGEESEAWGREGFSCLSSDRGRPR